MRRNFARMRKRISVRAAEPRDLDALVPLFEAYRAFYHREPDENAAREFLRERLTLLDSVVLIAEVESEGAACGFVQLYPVFSSLRMARALILNDLYVAEEYRRAGVARKLMEAAKAFALISGAVSLSLELQTTRRRARCTSRSGIGSRMGSCTTR
jgi:GNAT superfamily N-acetyltransferase